ncbi:MAG: lysostaphin resistance A-like protein [Suilimivivens sp.]
MNSKKLNRAFLITIILYIGVMFGAAFLPSAWVENIVFSNLLCESVIVLPGLLFLLFSKEKPGSYLHFKKIKPGTALAVIPFTMFSMPVITLANVFSQLFVKNEAMAAMEDAKVAEMPFLLLLFSTGIFAPFCEELVCRGIYYRGYKKSGSGFKAMFLSAALFALLHMNLNQAAYAFVMGMIAVLLVEATGSLWSSVIYHVLINSSQVAMMYTMLKANASAYSEAAELINTEMIVMMLASFLVITAVTLPLAWALLVWMSGHEGRQGTLMLLWKERKKKEDKLVTVPLILAIILCLAIIIWSYVIQMFYV